MPQEVRSEFHRELDRQEIAVGGLLGVIPEAVLRATGAMLSGDQSVVADLARWRALVGDLNSGVERAAEVLLARQAPVAGDLRQVLACTRMVPLLADTMDLVADVASPALAVIGPTLPARLHAVVDELGDTCAMTWSAVETLWGERDQRHLAEVLGRDDALSDIRSTLTAELASGSVDVSVAMQMAMAGRSYERLGRHATAAARLLEPLVRRGAPPAEPGGRTGW